MLRHSSRLVVKRSMRLVRQLCVTSLSLSLSLVLAALTFSFARIPAFRCCHTRLFAIFEKNWYLWRGISEKGIARKEKWNRQIKKDRNRSISARFILVNRKRILPFWYNESRNGMPKFLCRSIANAPRVEFWHGAVTLISKAWSLPRSSGSNIEIPCGENDSFNRQSINRLTLQPRVRRASPPRPRPHTPTSVPCRPPSAANSSGTVDRSSSRGHTQPKGCQLLFAVHFAPFCCSSVAPFIIHRSSYCGARYNAQLQHDDGQNTLGRVVSHSVTALRRRYEWHRGRKRALARLLVPALLPGSFAHTLVHVRVSARLWACRYTACTLVKIQSEHESAMGTFIVHSYVVLSALHYAIVFSTRPPPALLLIMRITIISLCSWSWEGGRMVEGRQAPARFWYLYARCRAERDERA